MITLQKVLEYIEQVIPSNWAESWDNPGLQVGDVSSSVKEIAVTLDVTEESLEMAEECGCNLLISHHPLLFQPIHKLSLSSTEGRIISRAIRSGISLVSLHTNWDASPEGVNVTLAHILGLTSLHPLEEAQNSSWGGGAIGDMPTELDFPLFVDLLRKKWNLSWVTGYKASGNPIHRIALCGGSGSALVPLAISHHADIFITADMKYHQISAALDAGLALCIVDHGEMERLSLPVLANNIKSVTGLPVRVLETQALPMPILSVARDTLFQSIDR